MLSLDRNPAVPAASAAPKRRRRAQPRHAPPFSDNEAQQIANWSAGMRSLDITTEISVGHAYLTEALHVMCEPGDEPWWMVHKTPDGECAVRLWPGLADIVPSLGSALAIISVAVDTRHAARRAGVAPSTP